jgi:protoporphyrin/coproporphyrin ferrochelatase
MIKKTAVVLFNLGGPDNPEAVKPFLLNLFSDPAIIRLPSPLRWLAARLITAKREKIAGDIYASIGGRSPILENTQAQARALEKELTDIGDAKCFIAMRYWNPLANETAKAVKAFTPDRIVLLPLYPQFSTTTTASSLKNWQSAATDSGLSFVPTRTICCYPAESGFIKSTAGMLREAYKRASAHGTPRILFSAHGLPEKIVQDGDPYQYQCERSASALINELGVEKPDWVLCYQSRVGPMRWIGPDTDSEIRRAGREKLPVLIVPLAFVSENSETLYEIDILYRDLARHSGVPYFEKIPCVDTAQGFIAGLAKLVRQTIQSPQACISAAGGRLCPPRFSGCCNR